MKIQVLCLLGKKMCIYVDPHSSNPCCSRVKCICFQGIYTVVKIFAESASKRERVTGPRERDCTRVQRSRRRAPVCAAGRMEVRQQSCITEEYARGAREPPRPSSQTATKIHQGFNSLLVGKIQVQS